MHAVPLIRFNVHVNQVHTMQFFFNNENHIEVNFIFFPSDNSIFSAWKNSVKQHDTETGKKVIMALIYQASNIVMSTEKLFPKAFLQYKFNSNI
jgi:hypothetical protein